VSGRLNVGCGPWLLAGFINCDANPEHPCELHATVPPIPMDDGSLSEVWGCHFIEHLPYETAQEFVREAWRVLEPGGTLGLVVPDTREIMTRWLAGNRDCVEIGPGQWYPAGDLDAICHLWLYSTVQESRHQWSYEKGTLRRLVEPVGFVYQREIDRFRDPRLGSGAWHQCGCEWRKP
jgi:predicted SAM-dependent methyltransferase